MRTNVCNVLVIGSGAAGMRAAIAAHEAGAHVTVLGKPPRFGALAFDLHTGERTVFLADAVILCTGGHTRLWRRSSSRRDENFGDGFGLLLEAGVELVDMELVQFHPTGVMWPEDVAGRLITE